MKDLGYKIVYAVFYVLSLLPLRVMYVVSDLLFPIAYYVVRYRRGIVRNNLQTSFPEKSPAEILHIEKRFYHWFLDYFFETIKLLSISSERLLQHLEFRGADQIAARFDQGQSCAAMLGHYGNWEYLSATALSLPTHPDAVMGLIYHPLRNKAFDRLFIALRERHGGTCIPKKDILRYLVGYRRDHTMSLFGYIADQSPKWDSIHLWLDFLHHDTPVFTGAERIIRKMGNAVYYVDMERPRRGKYIFTFRELTLDPQSLEEHALTRRFFVLLEESIRRDPACYLWSHARWKRTHEEYDRRVREGLIKNR